MYKELLPLAAALVNELIDSIDDGKIGLKETEEKVLEFTNMLGGLMIESILQKVEEPTTENSIIIDEKAARYDKIRPRVFISRFGNKVERKRRCYKILGGGGVAPLDERLGIDFCSGYSPLMTYLISSFGGSGAFAGEAKKLGQVIGFPISSTAMQGNTERTGDRIPENPFNAIDSSEESTACEVMVIEIDGTMSPQITEIPGITGRLSLKNPTEYKECNVVIIEKYVGNTLQRRWSGALYGPRKLFDDYVRKAALRMGQLNAKEVVFIADGAHSNWEIQKNNFPEATTILDFYHAAEHLGEFCNLIKEEKKAKVLFERWRHMLRAGDYLQVIEEMKEKASATTDSSKAQTQINYFENNKERLQYKDYEELGYPLGSGLVEGACKNVVGKRFKGSGMRWKKKDNASVLRVRLSLINGNLDEYFRPCPRHIVPFLFCQEGVAA